MKVWEFNTTGARYVVAMGNGKHQSWLIESGIPLLAAFRSRLAEEEQRLAEHEARVQYMRDAMAQLVVDSAIPKD